MTVFQVFLIGFLFSFIGSIPPGTLNISVIQLSLSNRFDAAVRFALAAAIIEYPYAFIAVKFAGLITASPWIATHFTLLAAMVMLLLGAINLFQKDTSGSVMLKFRESGFRKGVILSLLNPLAIPFWIGVTAYLKSIGWIRLPTLFEQGMYVFGVSVGTFVLLYLLALLARKFTNVLQRQSLIRKIPGIIFIFLGFYALAKHFISMG